MRQLSDSFKVNGGNSSSENEPFKKIVGEGVKKGSKLKIYSVLNSRNFRPRGRISNGQTASESEFRCAYYQRRQKNSRRLSYSISWNQRLQFNFGCNRKLLSCRTYVCITVFLRADFVLITGFDERRRRSIFDTSLMSLDEFCGV